jgi:hypothetical protein
MKLLVVGGTWDCKGGRPSQRVRELIEVLRPERWVNGGDVAMLMRDQIQIEGVDAVVWMPKVDNAEPKGAREIKKRFPHVLLVTSKANLDGRYDLPDLVAHALSLKSNLLIEITKAGSRFLGRLIDPLGNVWAETSYWDELGKALEDRLRTLAGLTRVESVRVNGPEKGVQLDEPFFDLVRRHAEKFQALIQPPPGMTRFLGNATFRCSHGFPAYRVPHENGTWCLCVSRRNVDKRLAGSEMFVPVEPKLGDEGRPSVLYHGPHKPSVDTPVMVKLFEAFGDRARYAMHGHVYVKDAPMTSECLPCGCLEEFEEILEAVAPELSGWYRDRPDVLRAGMLADARPPFAVNLRGHGFVALSPDLEFLDGLEYVARPAWEKGMSNDAASA